jgi:drug/metabolite transporter (DMT)-like permease
MTWNVLRGMAYSVAGISLVTALQTAEFSFVYSAIQLIPLVTVWMSVVGFNETASSLTWVCIASSLLGAFIAIGSNNQSSLGFYQLMLMLIHVLAVSFFLASQRLVAKKYVPIPHQLLISNGMVSLFCMPLADWKQIIGFAAEEWLLICAIALLFLVVTMLIAKAFTYSTPAVLMPFEHLGLVFALVASVFFFSEQLSLRLLIGSIIIVFSSLTYLLLIDNE